MASIVQQVDISDVGEIVITINLMLVRSIATALIEQQLVHVPVGWLRCSQVQEDWSPLAFSYCSWRDGSNVLLAGQCAGTLCPPQQTYELCCAVSFPGQFMLHAESLQPLYCACIGHCHQARIGDLCCQLTGLVFSRCNVIKGQGEREVSDVDAALMR